MVTLLRKWIVQIRKKQRCFACLRIFDKGRSMFIQTCRSDEGIYNLHSCDACEALMMEFEYGIDDDELTFAPGCVHNGLTSGQTPEMLLEELRNNKPTNP